MNYETAKAAVFASGTIKNGYCGDTVDVEFALIGHRVVTVAECGCFSTGLPDATDTREAAWLLEHHPEARNISVTRIGGQLVPQCVDAYKMIQH